jgi:hypothetical protein
MLRAGFKFPIPQRGKKAYNQVSNSVLELGMKRQS